MISQKQRHLIARETKVSSVKALIRGTRRIKDLESKLTRLGFSPKLVRDSVYEIEIQDLDSFMRLTEEAETLDERADGFVVNVWDGKLHMEVYNDYRE